MYFLVTLPHNTGIKPKTDWREGSVDKKRGCQVPVMSGGDAVTHHRHKRLAFAISDSSATMAQRLWGMRQAETVPLPMLGQHLDSRKL